MAIREQPDQADRDRGDEQSGAPPAPTLTHRARRARPSPARTRSIGTTLLALLLIPLLALVGLWAFVASVTLGNRIRFAHYDTETNKTSASFTTLTAATFQERALTLSWLASGRRTSEASLLAVRHVVDTSGAQARQAYASLTSLLNPTNLQAMHVYFADLAGLPRIRAGVDAGAYTVVSAYQAYDKIITDQIALLQTSSPVSDPTLEFMTQAADAATRLEGRLAGAMSLIGAALADGGRMSSSERVLLAEVVGQQQLDVSNVLTLATKADRPIYTAAFTTAAFHQFQALENQILASPPNRPIPVNPVTFGTTSTRLMGQISNPLHGIGTVVGARAGQLRDSLTLQLALAAGLGLLAILAAGFVALRLGRQLRGELVGLYNSARAMATERLPRVVERLRQGEEVNVADESPPLPAGRITEIANVADAFSSVQRTAVESAVGQADLRKGVNQVFLNLSLRNQSLLHRQLGMLDTMERATNEPDALADLFRLDHLTTRMRRHAEGLIILAGSTPGRGWREPVPVLDVLRAAIAEVEDYVRVDVASESPDSVVGAAVNDVIHLLAELVENATSFSPPNTRVEIRADAVGIGFAVEIEDRGLGLAPDELAEINARLASPPEFDLARSDQLGLFVVGQLAARHGIRVSLRESPYGGTTAIVILPHHLIAREDGTDLPGVAAAGAASQPWPGGDGDPVANRARASAFSMTGRHRLDTVPPPGDGWPGEPAAADAGPADLASTGPMPVTGRAPAPWGPASRPEPPAGRPPWDAPRPPGPVPDTPDTPDTPGGAGQVLRSVPGGSHRGLPRRVRQANMAPQLRGRTATPVSDPAPAAAAEVRNPDEVRSMMSSLQEGWQRGRVDDLDYTDEEPGGWPGGTPGAPDENDGEGL
jgi:signal transduction histidine kinase